MRNLDDRIVFISRIGVVLVFVVFGFIWLFRTVEDALSAPW